MSRDEALALITKRGAHYELAEIEQHGYTCRAFVNAPATLRDFFEAARSDREFYVYEDERYTYEEAWERAARIANVLIDAGVGKGDRVAISMRNYPEWVFAFFAVTAIGGIAVAMNALWRPDEMHYGLSHAGAKVLIADQERLDRMAEMKEPIEGMRIFAVRPDKPLTDGITQLCDAMAEASPQMPAADVAPDDDATFLYTSGSTGHPKGVVSCHRAVISALWSWEVDLVASYVAQGLIEPTAPMPLPEDPVVFLLGTPLFHVAGSHAVLLNTVRLRGRAVALYRWDVERAAELIEQEKVTNLIATPAMTGDIVEHAAVTTRDLSSLALVGGGGAPRAAGQVRKIDANLKAAPSTGWGMTETNAIGAGVAGDDYLARPTSSGRCSVVLDLRVVDTAGIELPRGQRGELQVRGTSMFREYWNRPDANDEAFAGDGWFRTGDVAFIDDDGFVFIVDRIKDLVIRGGENIGCGAVEGALVEHPAIVEAAVFGVPDDRLGEEVGTTIYASAPVTEDEIREFLASRLAKFEIPRYIHVEKEPLPRIASGKIFKRGLRGEALARLGIEPR